MTSVTERDGSQESESVEFVNEIWVSTTVGSLVVLYFCEACLCSEYRVGQK